MSFRNSDYIRSISGFGQRLYEALADLDNHHSTLAQQVNGNGVGQPAAPPGITSLQVSGQNGHFQIAITDPNPIYRDIHYWLEHADNPAFTSPQVVHMGQSRNYNLFLGSATRYFRAYSSYSSSAPSAPVYFGGAQPQAVSGGGSVGAPNFLPSQGSGTGQPGQGLQGPGTTPFRSTTGIPPVR